jgi:hypothetical protein
MVTAHVIALTVSGILSQVKLAKNVCEERLLLQHEGEALHQRFTGGTEQGQ